MIIGRFMNFNNIVYVIVFMLIIVYCFVFIGCSQVEKPKPVANYEDTVVFITDDNKEFYHNQSCKYLINNKVPVTLKQAKERGYTPCPVCNPPKL